MVHPTEEGGELRRFTTIGKLKAGPHPLDAETTLWSLPTEEGQPDIPLTQMPLWVKQALSRTSRRAARRSGGSRKAKPTSPSSSSPEVWEVPVNDGTVHSTELPPASSSEPQRHGPNRDVSDPVQELPVQATTVPETAAVALETEPEISSSQAGAYMNSFCTSSTTGPTPTPPVPRSTPQMPALILRLTRCYLTCSPRSATGPHWKIGYGTRCWHQPGLCNCFLVLQSFLGARCCLLCPTALLTFMALHL